MLIGLTQRSPATFVPHSEFRHVCDDVHVREHDPQRVLSALTSNSHPSGARPLQFPHPV